MSGHLRDDDAGDVLSSIRRLVTDAAPAPAKQPPAGRLVLTPALRVDTRSPANTPSPTPAATDGATGDAPAASDAPERAASQHTPPLALQGSEAAPSLAPHASDGVSLERTIAELEAAVAASFDDWEAEEAGGVGVFRAGARDPDDNAVPRAEVPEQPPEDADTAQVVAEVGEASRAAGADLGPASADVSEDDPESATQAVALDDLADDEEFLVDEAALRDLIAQIVREELRGTLGERITRNVRKLVRSEVARALASRDFAAARDPD